MKIVRTPIRTPNAYTERGVGTLRRECLDRILIVNRRQLEHVLRVYTTHYNQHRPHRSLLFQPPEQNPAAAVALKAAVRASPADIHIQRRDLLAGLIHEYEHAA